MAPIQTTLSGVLATAVLLAGSQARGESPADGPADSQPVRASLVASVDAAAPEQEFRLGVLLELAPHWHVYWTSPGNTGTPTRVALGWDRKLASVEEPCFPVPEVFDAANPEFLSFGYNGSVLIPAAASVAESPPGGYTEFTASVSWLACKKTCVEGKAALSLRLPVEKSPRPSALAGRFASLESALPEEADSGRVWLESLTYGKGRYTALFRVAPGAVKEVTGFIPALPAGGDCRIESHGVVPSKGAAPVPGERPALELVFSGDRCLPGLGGLLLGRAADAGDGSPARAFAVEASPGEGGGEERPAGDGAAAAPAAAGGTSPAAAGPPPAAAGEAPREALWLMLLFAFLGGLLLNVMPCVIPVVVPKLLSVVRTAQKSSGAEQKRVLWSNGLAYTAGVVTTMLTLGATVVVLKLVGREVGWGFQFQNPWFLVFMISLLLVLGLGMLHVYPLKSAEHQDQLKNLKKQRRSKPRWESFFTGLLVTFLGTPCTAPMLGPALGYAFTASPVEILLLMFTVGLGLSAPFLLLGAWTGWTRVLPTRVSERYDKIMRGMAFLLFGTAVWLLGVLASAYGGEAALNVTWFLLALGLASWVFGLLVGEQDPWSRRLVRLAPLLALVALAGGYLLEFPSGAAARAGSKGGGPAVHLIKWQPFSEQRVQELQAGGKTVFIDFTADWCMNCKANERLVIETGDTLALMDRLQVAAVKADFTRPDPVIQRWLRRFGRAGVPMYIVLPACGEGKDAVLLPEILTPDTLHGALEKAGGSRKCK